MVRKIYFFTCFVSFPMKTTTLFIAQKLLKLSFTSQLKLGFIKLVNLNYTSVCTICFQLTHCVEVQDNLHLFIYGDQACYVWWQYLLGFLVIPTLLMFPPSAGVSLDLLKEGYISTAAFVTASVMPFYSIYLLLKKVLCGLDRKIYSQEDELYIRHVMFNEETLFKFDRRYPVRWPVIQLYRNLLIVFAKIFILNPFYRCLFYVVLLLVFFTHDVQRKPYKNSQLNRSQMLSSSLLILFTLCNIPASISSIGDVVEVPGMIKFIHRLKIVEIFLLAALPVSVVGFIVWSKLRSIVDFLISRRGLRKSLSRSVSQLLHEASQ